MKYTKQEATKVELFENLLPMLIYRGEEEQKKEFWDSLCNDGNHLLHDVFKEICEDDEIVYEYGNHDYQVKIMDVGGLFVIQIQLPEINKNINDIKRAYFVAAQSKQTGELVEHRYFTVKYETLTGKSFIQFTAPNGKLYLGDELTEKDDDMQYELWRLARNYIAVLSKNVGEEKEVLASGR